MIYIGNAVIHYALGMVVLCEHFNVHNVNHIHCDLIVAHYSIVTLERRYCIIDATNKTNECLLSHSSSLACTLYYICPAGG